MSILKNKIRNGNFTSSKIFNLLKLAKDQKSFGAPALNYIKEKQWERKLGRSLNTDVSTKPILWGRFLEKRVHDLLPLSYEWINDETLQHPKYEFWVGSPDNKEWSTKTVCDTKCPGPKAFCELVDNLKLALKYKDISYFRDNHEDYYWQLVSNACILGADNIELIVYMPYESELPDIRLAVEEFDSFDQYKYRWIAESAKEELSYLPDGGEYKNINRFRFALDRMDAIKLEGKVISANRLLEI